VRELFALADAIATVFGGSVAIEDLQQNVIAYSTLPGQVIDGVRTEGILSRRVPAARATSHQYREVLDSDGVVRFPLWADELPRTAVAIRAGAMPLGTIWAIEDGTSFTVARERALLDAVGPAALHLLRAGDPGELYRRRRSEALEALLEGRTTDADAAHRVKLALGGEFTLTAFTTTGSGPDPTTLRQVGTAVTRHYSAYRPGSAVASHGGAVYVLLPDTSPESAVLLARSLLATMRRQLGLRVRAAVSSPGDAPTDTVELRREVDEVLRCSGADPDGVEVATVRDVQAQILLAHVSDVLRRNPRIGHHGVAAMVENDRTRQSRFAETVLAWLDDFGNVPAAARRLKVHENTVRYRLARATTLFDLELGNPDERLSIWLQLRSALATPADPADPRTPPTSRAAALPATPRATDGAGGGRTGCSPAAGPSPAVAVMFADGRAFTGVRSLPDEVRTTRRE
jgi:hypothetical protein